MKKSTLDYDLRLANAMKLLFILLVALVNKLNLTVK